jgi:hypothetical protein
MEVPEGSQRRNVLRSSGLALGLVDVFKTGKDNFDHETRIVCILHACEHDVSDEVDVTTGKSGGPEHDVEITVFRLEGVNKTTDQKVGGSNPVWGAR